MKPVFTGKFVQTALFRAAPSSAASRFPTFVPPAVSFSASGPKPTKFHKYSEEILFDTTSPFDLRVLESVVGTAIGTIHQVNLTSMNQKMKLFSKNSAELLSKIQLSRNCGWEKYKIQI